MKYFLFWQRFLFYSCIVFSLFGLFLALYPNNVLFQYYFNAVSRHFWHQTTIQETMWPFVRFVCGPLGGTIACCYLLAAYVVWFPFSRKERWARTALILSFLLWFFIDSWVCITCGFYFQVFLINAFSLVVKALPVIFTWKAFNVQVNQDFNQKK